MHQVHVAGARSVLCQLPLSGINLKPKMHETWAAQACALVSALLSALLRLAAQHLQASNLASFDAEVGGCRALHITAC